MESFWSTSVMKKKKFRFGVELRIATLSNYAPASGLLFAKVRLEERANGDFEANTERKDVCKHRATWDQAFAFTCKIYAKPQIGVLEECLLRISIRKEGKTGKTEKLGYTSLNLAELAGVGTKERRCLLQSYDTNNYKGRDNSILLVSINVTLQRGDPVYQRPLSMSPSQTSMDPELDLKSFAGSSRPVSASESPSPPASPTTPRKPPQLFQNFLSRRATMMPSILTSSFMKEGKVHSTPDLADSAKYGHGDAISIGSNDLTADLLDVDSTLVADSSTLTILAGSAANSLSVDAHASRPRQHVVMTTGLDCSNGSRSSVPSVTWKPTSVVSLDSAFESNCSSTAFQHSMNSDHLSLSSTNPSSSLRFSTPDLVDLEEGEGEEKGEAQSDKFLEASDSGSGSTSAPATVRRRRSSFRRDAHGIEDVKFNSLETTSRQSRVRRSSRPGIESTNPSIKSSGRASVVSMRDSITSIKHTVESTRMDAADLIDALISKSSENIIASDSAKDRDSSLGMQLYIGADGSTAIGGNTLHSQPMSASHYRKVVVNPS